MFLMAPCALWGGIIKQMDRWNSSTESSRSSEFAFPSCQNRQSYRWPAAPDVSCLSGWPIQTTDTFILVSNCPSSKRRGFCLERCLRMSKYKVSDPGKIIIKFLTKWVASPWKPGYAVKCSLFLKGKREPHCAVSLLFPILHWLQHCPSLYQQC